MKNAMKKQGVVISVVLVIALGFVVYANSLQGQFIWDDNYLIIGNTYIRHWSCLGEIFTGDIGAGAGVLASSYRPLQIASYMVDYSLWQLNVLGYHLTNIVLHILVALGIYWFIHRLFGDKLLAFLTSIFFVVHPIHTEVVSYISGRPDSLALVFILLSFILYIRQLGSTNIKCYILMLLSYIAALLSREGAVILPVLFLFYHYTFKEKIKLKVFLSFVIITCVYLVLRLTVLKSFRSEISYSTLLFHRLPGFFVAIASYLKLLLLPFNLHMEYGIQGFPFQDPKVIIGIAIVILSLIYAFIQRNRNRIIVFAIGWFFIALLPVSNIIYPINVYMAEHWLYLPSMGFFLIFAQGLSVLYKRKKSQTIGIVLSVSLLTFYSFLTIKQNYYWRDPIFFYERTLTYAPYSGRLFHNLADAYQRIGKYKEAITSYQKAITFLNPRDVTASTYNRLGVSYALIGMPDEALSSFKQAIELDPHSVEAYTNLGNAYATMGKFEEAAVSYKKAIEIDPSYTAAHDNLNNLYGQNPSLKKQ